MNQRYHQTPIHQEDPLPHHDQKTLMFRWTHYFLMFLYFQNFLRFLRFLNYH
jgi:hypothetical protein